MFLLLLLALFVLGFLTSFVLARRRRQSAAFASLRSKGSCSLPRLREAFDRVLHSAGGSPQLAVVVRGKLICDLHGDAGRDALNVFFSMSKVLESLIFATLVDDGLVAYEDPVKKHFPKFYTNEVTIADLARHRSGCGEVMKTLPVEEIRKAFSDPELLEAFVLSHLSRDFNVKNRRRTFYHPFSRGLILAVLIRRLTGETPNEYIQRRLVGRVSGQVECHVGANDSHLRRIPRYTVTRSMASFAWEIFLYYTGISKLFVVPKDAPVAERRKFLKDWLTPVEIGIMSKVAGVSASSRAFRRSAALFSEDLFPQPAVDGANDHKRRSIPMLSATIVSNAASTALIMGEAVRKGGNMLSAKGLASALETDGPVLEEALGLNIAFTNCGWCSDLLRVVLADTAEQPDCLDGWYGWVGTGGSVCFVNPEFEAAVCWIPTAFELRLVSPGMELIEIVAQELKKSK